MKKPNVIDVDKLLENDEPDEKYVEQLYERFRQGEMLDPIHELLLRAAGKIPENPSHPLLKKKNEI